MLNKCRYAMITISFGLILVIFTSCNKDVQDTPTPFDASIDGIAVSSLPPVDLDLANKSFDEATTLIPRHRSTAPLDNVDFSTDIDDSGDDAVDVDDETMVEEEEFEEFEEFDPNG